MEAVELNTAMCQGQEHQATTTSNADQAGADNPQISNIAAIKLPETLQPQSQAPHSSWPSPGLHNSQASSTDVQVLLDLPRGILITMLSLLSAGDLARSCSVCKAFASLCAEALGKVSSFEIPGTATQQGLHWLGHCPHLQSLKEVYANGTTCSGGLALLVGMPLGPARLGGLRMLTIDTCKQLRDETLSLVLQYCPLLEVG